MADNICKIINNLNKFANLAAIQLNIIKNKIK